MKPTVAFGDHSLSGVMGVKRTKDRPMRLKNIEFLIDGNGDVTLGRIGPVRCAAVAADEDRQLAALVRGRGESLEDLPMRLDAAIEAAWEKDVFLDEING
jgi:hypothetical protein